MNIWRARAIWMGGILLFGVLYLFENHGGTLLLLVGVIALPLVWVLPCRLGRKGMTVSITVPEIGEKNMPLQGKIRLENRMLFPLQVRAEVLCQNVHTGETCSVPLQWCMVKKAEEEITIKCQHCGKISITLDKGSIIDPFGLFSFSFFSEEKKELVILPEVFPMELSLADCSAEFPDSDSYVTGKAGNDPGEVYAIRQYVPGDAIGTIHWKLSEKNGTTLVRQYGLPAMEEVLLFVELGKEREADVVDGATEAAVCVLQALERKAIPFRLGWQTEKGDFMLLPALQEGAFPYLLEELLSRPVGGASVVEGFLGQYQHCGFSHVLVVGTQVPTRVGDLYNGNRVTVLVPTRGLSGMVREADGTILRTFTMRNLRKELAALEV